ncbi:DUF3096 domain-containing protein [bacterium]|nr:DUF3096 domain-containing protein [candidate division CSSED10-310 bacterium]
MTINLNSLPLYGKPVIALFAGVLILIRPRLLNYVVAFYLIITGIIGLIPLFD